MRPRKSVLNTTGDPDGTTGGSRRGELVAFQWGDIQFGTDENDSNRFILVRHNYVRREHTTTKSKKSRRVDVSRELRKVLLELRATAAGSLPARKRRHFWRPCLPSPGGTILDPDNLYHRYFQPVLTKAGLRKIRFHTSDTLSAHFSSKVAHHCLRERADGTQLDPGDGGHLRPPDSRGKCVICRST